MKLATNVFLILFFLLGVDVREVWAQEKSAYVTICFDDAHSSVFTYALPIFQQQGLVATVYVPTIGIDDKPYWHMSWGQVVLLRDAGWEIGSHSHTHHSMLQFSPEKIDEEMRLSQLLLAKHGITATTFAAPLGDSNDEIIKGAKKYYVAQRGTERVRGDQLNLSLNDLNVDPFNIAAIQLWYDDSLLKIEELVELAIKEKKWVVFYLHAISEGQPEDKDYKFDVHNLSQLMSYLSDLQDKGKLQVVTIAEFLKQREGK